jgi:hypothetical protein
MNNYEYVKGNRTTITCDNCSKISNNWYANDYHTICIACFFMEVSV